MGKRPLRKKAIANATLPSASTSNEQEGTVNPSSRSRQVTAGLVVVGVLVVLYGVGSFELLPALKATAYGSGTLKSIRVSSDDSDKEMINNNDDKVNVDEKLLKTLVSKAFSGTGVESFPLEAVQAILDRTQFCLPWSDDDAGANSASSSNKNNINSDAWWTHNPDWFVSVENDTHYCFAPIMDEEKANYMRQIYQNQFQNNCSTLITEAMWSSGWGADMSNLMTTLHFGMTAEHRPIQMYHPKGWHYAAPKKNNLENVSVCPSRDMYCYFLNMTNCPAVPSELRKQVLGRLIPFNKRPYIWYMEYATRQQQWLRRHVYQYTKTAVPGLAKAAGEAAKQGKQCATLHVRRSDVTLHPNDHSRKYYAIPEYFEGGKALLGHPLPNDIFLLTDDQNAIDEAYRDYPDTNWMMMNRTRFRGDSGGFENQIPSGDALQEVVVILATFRLIQYCPMLVHARSTFSDVMWGILQENQASGNIQATRVDLRDWLRKESPVERPQA